ncbi:polysaccharide deacetylase family protein [Microvirga pudoricolor]|uniref:polysaccharide deacetylase family protein n=1 Tax=Microvirga pudoricolor TaxID=2778729 RepID=UPI00194F8709|nr:polysaccharide deacetylase family protein [Microvirga pudoricolor]MBM6595303.1 polysaccharide deacetylase family protein [Microvirga pudoricolor]
MPTQRRPGMDHTIYLYSALPERPAFALPGGRTIAVYIVLQIEHYELTAPEGSYRDPRFKGEFGNYTPDYRTWSSREYGNRVGLYRVLSVLDQLQIPVTAAVGAGAIEAHPEIVGEIASRGYEVIAHGLTANRMITSRMSRDEEASHIRNSRDAVAAAFGKPPEGWLSQDFGTTPSTSELLSACGFSYTLDWSNDEQPYRHNGARGLVALPAPSEWDDVQSIWLRKLPAHRFPILVSDALDGLSAVSASNARSIAIGVHPWVFGSPHRIRYLQETLELVKAHPGVEMMTAGALVDHFNSLDPAQTGRQET